MEPPVGRSVGQAMVEFAIVAPVLMLTLLGVLAAGLYFVAATQQANAATTVASWAAANPDDDLEAFAAGISPCVATATWADDVVTVTLSCENLAHSLIPAFPENVVSTATAFSAPTP